MNRKTLIPALILGLSVSSVAFAKKKDGGLKRTRVAKIEKEMGKAKVKKHARTAKSQTKAKKSLLD